MRVGIVCPYSFDVPGGVQNHVRDLAEALIRLGHEVSVLAPADDTMSLMIRGPARFKPRPRCAPDATIVREIRERRQRMIALLPRLADGTARLLDLDGPS